MAPPSVGAAAMTTTDMILVDRRIGNIDVMISAPTAGVVYVYQRERVRVREHGPSWVHVQSLVDPVGS